MSSQESLASASAIHANGTSLGLMINWAGIREHLQRRFPSRILTIDSHTAGEPTRLIVAGIPPLPGKTMPAKLEYFRTHLDAIRCLLTSEPRGHRDMLAAAVTEAATQGADFGLIYMDARRYPLLCGHATIGAVTTLIEAGTSNFLPTAAWELVPPG